MNIIVLIKQVPDTSEVKINPETNTLIRDGVPSIINPFDMYAIEEAIRLREKHGGKVTVLSMGPPQAAEALKEAIKNESSTPLPYEERVTASGSEKIFRIDEEYVKTMVASIVKDQDLSRYIL